MGQEQRRAARRGSVDLVVNADAVALEDGQLEDPRAAGDGRIEAVGSRRCDRAAEEGGPLLLVAVLVSPCPQPPAEVVQPVLLGHPHRPVDLVGGAGGGDGGAEASALAAAISKGRGHARAPSAATAAPRARRLARRRPGAAAPPESRRSDVRTGGVRRHRQWSAGPCRSAPRTSSPPGSAHPARAGPRRRACMSARRRRK